VVVSGLGWSGMRQITRSQGRMNAERVLPIEVDRLEDAPSHLTDELKAVTQGIHQREGRLVLAVSIGQLRAAAISRT
jgi:hypothetical protein